jgi:hypothetical protein
VLVLSAGCSSVKHVPQGSYLLDNVDIVVDDNKSVSSEELVNFLRQTPNHKVLGFAKLQLSTYSLSGRDSTRWYNRWLRSLGQAPVIYDETLTDASRRQLRQALINRGYMDANVAVDTTFNAARRRANVVYRITTGRPHTIKSVKLNVADSAVAAILEADTALVESRATFSTATIWTTCAAPSPSACATRATMTSHANTSILRPTR